jgi:hypothetical protein
MQQYHHSQAFITLVGRFCSWGRDSQAREQREGGFVGKGKEGKIGMFVGIVDFD